MADYNDRLLSRPMRLHWAGWETTTYRLQQAGWELSAYQDMAAAQLGLAVRHPQHAASGMVRCNYDYWRSEAEMPTDTPIGMQLGRDVHIHHTGDPLQFLPIDATPQFSERITALDHYARFAPQTNLTAPFVLPEPDVDELLQRILEKQQAAKTDYFRDLVRREGQILPAHKFHAQIISLAA